MSLPSHSAPRIPRWRRYVRFWRSDAGADVEEEFGFHIQERIDDLVARGLDSRAAREEALRRFGDIEQVTGTCRSLATEQEHDMRRAEFVATIRQDVGYALRVMRSNPGFTAAIALTLALGIGATTSIFSVVHAVLLRPLPYADGDRIVMIWERFREGQGRASAGHFSDWTEQSTSFAATAAFQGRNYNLTDGEPTRLYGARVTPGFFQVAYMPPALGRYFLPGDTEASRVVVLSHPLWEAHFQSDPGIIGREVTLNGERHTVVGVTPPAYTLTAQDERLWTPLAFAPEQRANYGAHTYLVMARLKAGVSLDAAQRDLDRVTEEIRSREPVEMIDRGVRVQPFTDVLVESYRTQLWVLLGAVSFVLLIGCANVASLLLARAMSRRKEIAIRGALGGARSRLMAQLLTESFVLALLGGGLGVLVARVGVRFLIGTAPSGVPRMAEAGLQPEVLAFAAATTLVCGVLFGLAPALRATRLDLQSELREGGRGSRSALRDRARGALIVTEMAVALVLLVSAGLFIRSAIRLQRIAPGFDPAGVTMMRVALPADRYDSARAANAAFEEIVRRVRAIPGVEHAAASTRVPMWGISIDIGVHVDGRPVVERAPPHIAHVRLVTAGFAEALGIPLEQGRLLRESDMAAGAQWVVLVNETFARNLFGTENPVGQRISGWTSTPEPEWREIVGVIGDVRAFGRENDIPPEIFVPTSQAASTWWSAHQRSMTVVARATPGAAVATPMRNAVKSVDPLLPLYDLQTMDQVLAQSTATRRFHAMLLTLLSLTGLMLAAIGIYGVMAFFVTQRTHEIGVRIALGASTTNVIVMIVRQAAVLAVAGVVLGGLATLVVTRSFGSMLFQTDARDPIAFGIAALVLLGVALAAAWLPARRAARVEPVLALANSG